MKRYNPDFYIGEFIGMSEMQGGEYILHKEYEKEKKERDKYIERLETVIGFCGLPLPIQIIK